MPLGVGRSYAAAAAAAGQRVALHELPCADHVALIDPALPRLADRPGRYHRGLATS